MKFIQLECDGRTASVRVDHISLIEATSGVGGARSCITLSCGRQLYTERDLYSIIQAMRQR